MSQDSRRHIENEGMDIEGSIVQLRFSNLNKHPFKTSISQPGSCEPSHIVAMAAPNIKQSVLITGCSEGGIRYDLAKEFQRRGSHVFLRQLAAHPSWLILKTFLMSLGTVHDDAVNELQLVAREH